MQLRWVFNTKNTYDVTTFLSNEETRALNEVLRIKNNVKGLSPSDIKNLNYNLFSMRNVTSFSQLVALAPCFEYPIRPTNVTMSHKDLSLYGRLDNTKAWTLIYSNRKFVDNSELVILGISPDIVEEIKRDIQAQINELSNLSQ